VGRAADIPTQRCARGRLVPAGPRMLRWSDYRPEDRTVSVEQRVIDIVSEHFAYDKEKITRNTTFIEDIGADSLDIVEFVMELEEEFDIQIPDDQAEKIKTVGEAVDYIDQAVKNKPQ
jgi:acyl carrier protein